MGSDALVEREIDHQFVGDFLEVRAERGDVQAIRDGQLGLGPEERFAGLGSGLAVGGEGFDIDSIGGERTGHPVHNPLAILPDQFQVDDVTGLRWG